MKKKMLSKIIMVAMTVSILLTGCGEQTESRRHSAKNSEVVQEVEENVEKGSLFSGTIFDSLIMGETTKTDVENLLEDRVLEYEYVHVDNAIYSLSGKTTITDEFGEWNALYKYILVGSGAKEDYKLSDWTVELLLNEDAEYKDAVKYIQNTIDVNTLEGYTTIEDTYSDDLVKGDVTYYPVEKFKMNDVDGIKYIMFGKYANCQTEEAKHIIVLSVGIIEEEAYQKGEIIKIPTITIETEEIQVIPQQIQPHIEKDKAEYSNIVFFITDYNDSKSIFLRSTSIISHNVETAERKIVSIPRGLLIHADNDRYKKYSLVKNVEQAIKTLNINLDLDIAEFIAIDCKGLSKFVDALGGVWCDVPPEIEKYKESYYEYIMSMLETNQPIVLDKGYQLLNGNQLVMYLWYMGTHSESDNERQILNAIYEQMMNVDKVTLEQAFNNCISNVYTSLNEEDLQYVVKNISDFNWTDDASFPQENMYETVLMGANGKCIVPTDLEANVVWLHQFLFEQDNYEVSSYVKEYSSEMQEEVEKYRK